MKATRAVLGTLLAFCALNALGGGYYGLSGAPGVPTDWLVGSPFRDYLLPSLILFGGVGGSHAFAAFGVFTRQPHARAAAIAAGLILLVWIVTQVSIIGYVSWLQPFMGVLSLMILGLARMLPSVDA
ncbi:MAG TPA: hypothetical protein VHO25_00130 [Polyangiaceae bacterium]|nr:hypothetical protein [Polyangiaceae bacterium]